MAGRRDRHVRRQRHRAGRLRIRSLVEMRRQERSVTPIDLVVGAVTLALIALPIGGLSWIAVGGVALYILLFTDADPPMRRGALILLATTVPMFWSRLLFQYFANFILEIDASLVGWLLGTERTGNMVRFANDIGYLVIFPACSSLANMSLAFLCWITVSEFAEHRRALGDLWWCLLACGSVLAINVGRMSLMGISVQHYQAIHSQIGDAVTNAMILIVTLGWSFLGVRRELSPALKWLIAILLPLTLAWKLTVKADRNDHLEEDVIAFLTRQGFHTVVAEDTNFRRILAVNNTCRMRVMIASSDGADRDMTRSLVAADESLIFVHQGKVYQEQPILLTVSAEKWARALRKMGLTDRNESVLAVVAQRQCDAERLPWDQLQ